MSYCLNLSFSAHKSMVGGRAGHIYVIRNRADRYRVFPIEFSQLVNTSCWLVEMQIVRPRHDVLGSVGFNGRQWNINMWGNQPCPYDDLESSEIGKIWTRVASTWALLVHGSKLKNLCSILNLQYHSEILLVFPPSFHSSWWPLKIHLLPTACRGLREVLGLKDN